LACLQYFRFGRQWLCVDEFNGADVIVDTGTEIIEVEVKMSKYDLIVGERAKTSKHRAYKVGRPWKWNNPNKFMVCLPETLVDVALGWSKDINSKYGIIGFDVEGFERSVRDNRATWHRDHIRIAKSAKILHENYRDTLRWSIAKRTSSKIVSLMEADYKRSINTKE
jgi:hypothetical protein